MSGEARVECYSGYRAEQQPLNFETAGNRYEVTAVERHWREPEREVFLVRASESSLWRLERESASGEWRAFPAE